MSDKVTHYKVWIHIEGLNSGGYIIEGDDYFEPREAGCFVKPQDAERLRETLLDVAGAQS